MRIFIVGISGETGFRLASLLKRRGDEVDGLYRRVDQGEKLRSIGVAGTHGDLVRMDQTKLAHHFSGSDVIVFSAGAGDADSDAMIDMVDGDGVTKSIAAARRAGVERFVLVSVFPEAGRREGWGESFEHYIAVKKRADVELSRTELDWVIIRPSSLNNEPGVGAVSLGPAEFHTNISRDDVAATMAQVIHTPALRRKIPELTEGATPIETAVAVQAAG
ncbi:MULTISPECIES: NAD(P)H-binding protein [unclassified Bradyrhizobium]|uniref:NAD(P)H-binding protein n=1 Tax=unclassified Bradyrhizobium TaxID=2631580 RepID=UPI0028ED4621|nr:MULTISPECIES: NAD(P)H-binding protein [unclassified Bradyrhizobium]